MKRLTKALRYAAAAAVCVLAATTAVDAAVARQVRLVQVLHRHGARTAVSEYNTSEICKEVPCGYLNAAGFKMMENVGAFLRARYSEDAAVVDSPLLPAAYDLDAVYTRSTDVLRTLQSAQALLAGLFPASAGSLFPAVHTQDMNTDWALNSFAIPSVMYSYMYNVELRRTITNAAVDAAFPDWTVLQQIAAEVHSAGACTDHATRGDCGSSLNDIVAAFISSGEDAGKPLLRENFDKLQSVTRAIFDYMYRYDKSEEMRLRQGGRGQPFVQEVLRNMEGAISGTNTYKMMHYSAHDATVAPVWGTLGDRTAHGMLPPFSQTFVAELLQDATDQSYHVRVLRGHPGQTPESNYTFGWDDTWQLRCVDAGGAMYAAADNTCPLADFRRLTEWSKPTAAEGLCYLEAASREVVVCPADVAAGEELSGAAVGGACAFYRQQCPAVACGSGCVLDSSSLQCVCRGFRDNNTNDNNNGNGGGNATTTAPSVTVALRGAGDVSGGAAAGIAIATFCLGALLAGGAALITYVCLRAAGRGERYMEVDVPNKNSPREGTTC